MAGFRSWGTREFFALGVSAALLFGLVMASAALAGFAKPKTVRAKADVRAVATADLNRDGRTDLLAATNEGGKGLSVYLGKKNGFKTPVKYPTAGDSYGLSVAVGRFNGDKLPDVAVSLSPDSLFGDTAVQIFYSRANGKLKQGPSPEGMYYLQAIDLAGDGRTDLVGIRPFGGVRVLRNTKHGFAAAKDYDSAPVGPFGGAGLAVGKIDRDKLADVVTYNDSGQISTLLSKRDGTLRDYKLLETGATSQGNNGGDGGVGIGDLNKDGKGDVVYAAGDDARLLVYPGKGDGTYKAPSVDRGSAAYPRDVAVADVDGDRKLDAVLATKAGGPETLPYVFKGKGDGTFKGTYDQLKAANGETSSLALARLDDDKRLDLILGGFKFINVYSGKG